MRVVNIGSMNIDYFYSVPHFVEPGETLHATTRTRQTGGKGLNQSIALARAGVEVLHAGIIGEDGDALKACLEEYDVNTTLIKKLAGEASGHAVIQVDAQGQNCILLYSGTNFAFTANYIHEILNQTQAGDIVLLQNEINDLPYVIEAAHRRGLTVIFNAAPASAAVRNYPLQYLDYLIINEVEGKHITGETQPERITQALLSQYPNLKIVLTLGEDGAIFADKTQEIRVAAHPVDTVVDTTSAGDTFTGYFLSCWPIKNDRTSIQAALQLACRASALCIQRQGSSNSIPWRQELEESLVSLV
ncbi:MAG: ribokinase [Pseudomonadota bacterium]